MKNIKLLKPQPSPRNIREPLTNITNYFHSKPKSDKQTYRSPSHSPVNSSRATKNDKDQKKVLTPKAPMQAKYIHHAYRCINHKQKLAKFKIQADFNGFYYCQNCALQMNQKGRKVISLRGEDSSIKMISQAKQYLKNLQQIMLKMTMRRSEIRVQRYKLQSKYERAHEDIEQKRKDIIEKVNIQYDNEIAKIIQMKKKQVVKIEEYEDQLSKFEAEFKTIREDVSGNLNQINIHIEMGEFREIMNIYWQKIIKINEKISKQELHPIIDSAQLFINKYIPPSQPNPKPTFEQNLLKLKPTTPTNKQFTFSKNIHSKCRQTFSWQQSQSNKQNESNQSIVQQRIKIK